MFEIFYIISTSFTGAFLIILVQLLIKMMIY